MKSTFFFSLCLIFSLFSSTNLFAGAWTQNAGEYYGQFSLTYLRYGQLLNGSEEKLNLNRYVYDVTYQAYFEYGITNKLTMLHVLPIKQVGTGEQILEDPSFSNVLQEGSLSGLGNVVLGLKYNLINSNWVVSVQSKWNSRGVERDVESGLQTGDDFWGWTNTLLAGKSIKNGYMNFEAGAKYMEDQSYGVANFEIGKKYQIKEKDLWVVAVVDVYQPLSQVEGLSTYHQTGLFANNMSWVSPGVKMAYEWKKNTFINLGVYGAFHSINAGSFPTLNLGIAFQ